ncbi:MAG: hypothetical protein ACR2HY_09570 [Acidimicrobiales bacterium]
MSDRRFLNPAQPQTLQIAVFLLYLNAFFELLASVLGGGFGPLGLVFVVGQAGAGYGIANEHKWGYILAIAMAVLPFVARFYYLGNPLAGTELLTLLFEVALVALLIHPQSRDYQRIWFK